MKLTEHFTLAEFLRSETAARHGIDMTPDQDVVRNLERLALEVLEPIRRAVASPLIITSGYRPPALNTLIGGAPGSDHISGRAADFHALNMDLDELAGVVKNACEELPVARLIREFGQWLHVSLEPRGRIPTRRYLVASRDGSKTVYSEWA